MSQSKRIYKNILVFILCETLFYLFYSFPWALTFYTNITTTDPTKCNNPMWWWINFTNYYFWIASIWNIVSIPIRYNFLRREMKNEPKTRVATFIEAIKAIQIIGAIICMVMLVRAYEHRRTCLVLAGLVKIFIVSNLITIIIWCSGTYLIYIRFWNKAFEWIKKRENEEDLQAVVKRQKNQDKEKSRTKKQDEDEALLISNEEDQVIIDEEDSKKNFNEEEN